MIRHEFIATSLSDLCRVEKRVQFTCISSPCSATVSTSLDSMSDSMREVMGTLSALKTCRDLPA